MAALEASVAAAKQARGRHPSAGTRETAGPTSPEQADTAPSTSRKKKPAADPAAAEKAATTRRVRKSA
jgi:hypothetical protein